MKKQVQDFCVFGLMGILISMLGYLASDYFKKQWIIFVAGYIFCSLWETYKKP